jgi:NTE family protein
MAHVRMDLSELGYQEWSPAAHNKDEPSRALVLGGGGATGIGWLGGIIAALQEHDIDVRDADTMIGTSAGSVVATHLRLGITHDEAEANLRSREPIRNLGKLGLGDARRFVRANLARDRSLGRSLVGKAAMAAQTADEEAFLDTIAREIKGSEWPQERLMLTAVDAETGTAVVFTNESNVPLERAVAASCAVPGIFPPVRINGRSYVDGGLRSAANVDLAAGHDRVLVLAPLPLGFRRSDTPGAQARKLRESEARTLVIVPDTETRRIIGGRLLDMRRAPLAWEAGQTQGHRIADRVRRVWND